MDDVYYTIFGRGPCKFYHVVFEFYRSRWRGDLKVELAGVGFRENFYNASEDLKENILGDPCGMGVFVNKRNYNTLEALKVRAFDLYYSRKKIQDKERLGEIKWVKSLYPKVQKLYQILQTLEPRPLYEFLPEGVVPYFINPPNPILPCLTCGELEMVKFCKSIRECGGDPFGYICVNCRTESQQEYERIMKKKRVVKFMEKARLSRVQNEKSSSSTDSFIICFGKDSTLQTKEEKEKIDDFGKCKI